MTLSGDNRPEPEEEAITMPTVSETCPACKTTVESTCGDTEILKMMLQVHISVCKKMLEKQTGHPTVGQQKPKLVNVCRLDKMEVKDKPHGMQAADWIRFEERWNLWKADQPPKQNLNVTFKIFIYKFLSIKTIYLLHRYYNDCAYEDNG